MDLRAALHVHGANFGHHPAHGLQRGVVITDLHTAAHEVLLLEDDHAAALVGLKGGR